MAAPQLHLTSLQRWLRKSRNFALEKKREHWRAALIIINCTHKASHSPRHNSPPTSPIPTTQPRKQYKERLSAPAAATQQNFVSMARKSVVYCEHDLRPLREAASEGSAFRSPVRGSQFGILARGPRSEASARRGHLRRDSGGGTQSQQMQPPPASSPTTTPARKWLLCLSLPLSFFLCLTFKRRCRSGPNGTPPRPPRYARGRNVGNKGINQSIRREALERVRHK